MPASLERVLVLGAGELGMSVLRAFAEKHGPRAPRVTVMLRPGSVNSPDESKQRDQHAIRGWGFSILPFDISAATASELAVAMEAFELVISCTGFSAGVGTQVKIAQAVLAARVKKFVPWQFGVDYDIIGRGSAQELFDEQLLVRDMLRSQRKSEHGDDTPTTQWKIISTGIFCSFLFEPWFGIVEPQRSGSEVVVRALGSWEHAVTVTTVEDIGSLTVAVVLSPATEWDSVTFVAGDTVTYGQLVQLVQDAAPSSVSVRTQVWSSSHLETELRKDPTNAIRKYRVVFAAGVGISWDKKDTWNVRNDIETTTVGQWLAANSSVLARSEV